MPFSLAVLPKWLSFQTLMDFVFANIVWIIGFGALVYVALYYLKFGYKSKLKPVDRSEVERINFIKRMKENKPDRYKWLMRGADILGKIQSIRYVNSESKGNPEPVVLCQMVVKPTMFRRIPKPFAKSNCFAINMKKVERFNDESKSVELPADLTFDYLFGIYYDGSMERTHTDFIKYDNLFRSDLNQLASIYFAKSQEQSTFNPDYAHQLALKEKELQIEMAKKRGKITSI